MQKVVPKIPLKKEFLHNASFPYELLIRSCTIIVPIGIYKIPHQIEKVTLIEIHEARAKNNLIIGKLISNYRISNFANLIIYAN